MPYLTTTDADFYYETTGDGPPLLLIAGIASDHASWGPVAPTLAKHFKLVMPDNRGCGQTKSEGPISIPAMASDCSALLDHLSIGRAHVLGHSMGGAIALTLAAHAPTRIDGLILAASAAKIPARTISVIDTLAALRDAGVSDEHWLRSFFHWLFRPSFFDRKNMVDAAIALAIAYPHAQSLEDMRRQIEATRDYDNQRLFGAIAARTLLLSGEHDLMVSPGEIERSFADLPDKELQTLADAAHSLHWDQPAAFSAAVRAFLRG